MECLPESIFTSPDMFVFVVGPEAKEFTVHKAAFRPLSQYFRTLMDGNMKEAHDGRVIWDDIDPAVFMRLCRFAYANDYETPETPEGPKRSKHYCYCDCACCGDSHQRLPWENSDDENFLEWYERSESRLEELDGQVIFHGLIAGEALMIDHQAHRDPSCTIHSPATIAPTIGDNGGKSARKDKYIDNLHCNMEMYALGDRYIIEELQSLALHKLSSVLQQMRFTRMEEFTRAVHYAMKITKPKDKLRVLLARYAAAVSHRRFPELDRLMDESPMFALEYYHAAKHGV